MSGPLSPPPCPNPNPNPSAAAAAVALDDSEGEEEEEEQVEAIRRKGGLHWKPSDTTTWVKVTVSRGECGSLALLMKCPPHSPRR
jgi:hypothetical protein